MKQKVIDYTIDYEDLVLVDGFPQLKIRAIDHANKELIRTYWLSPFRRYCFQVSGNEHGENDIYSTPVIGLDNVIGAVNSMTGRFQYSNLSWGDSTSVIDVLFSGLAHKCIDGCMGKVEDLMWRIGKKNHEEEDYDLIPQLVIRRSSIYADPIDEFATICTLYLMKGNNQGKSWARDIYNRPYCRRSDRFYKIIEEMFGLENLTDTNNMIISKANLSSSD